MGGSQRDLEDLRRIKTPVDVSLIQQPGNLQQVTRGPQAATFKPTKIQQSLGGCMGSVPGVRLIQRFSTHQCT